MGMLIRVLIVEDSEVDALMIVNVLNHNGIDLDFKRVDTEKAFVSALQNKKWDIIISDYDLPFFSGTKALQLLKESHLDLPFIVVSGAIGEDIAVETMRAGAHDYVMKNNLKRLAPAIKRELVEAENRREKRRAEESLLLFRNLVDQSNDAIFVVVPESGSFIDINKQAYTSLGYQRGELLNLKVTDIEETITDSSLWEAHVKKLREAESMCLEGRNKRKDGTSFPVEVSLKYVKYGNIDYIVAVVRDISERIRLETQLKQAQKMEAIGQLAAGIAHEINTPMQFIGDNTRFLQDAFVDISKLLQANGKLLEALQKNEVNECLLMEIKTITENADLEYLLTEIPQAISQSQSGIEQVSRIVRAMKEFSHPDSKDKQPIDINGAIALTSTIARNEWKYVADMVTDFDPALPLVNCLGGEINQVILNMIVNAVHTITDRINSKQIEKGTIKISTKHEGDWVVIRISDNGLGIPKEIRAKIFEPFFTTKEVGKGTGQGLAISRAVIVDKHKGQLAFETEEGQGTTFIIRLPLAVADS